MIRILAINGSYRPGGIMDQALDAAAGAARAAGANVEVVFLRDVPIAFCQNCRACTQTPGVVPGRCVQEDGMTGLIERIEAADAYILASPTNFYSVTALFKRFMERLVVFAEWPWGRPAPKYRKAPVKPTLLIASSAAPGWMGRMFYTTMRQLRLTARTLGGKPLGNVFIGLASQQAQPSLRPADRKRIFRYATRLGRG